MLSINNSNDRLSLNWQSNSSYANWKPIAQKLQQQLSRCAVFWTMVLLKPTWTYPGSYSSQSNKSKPNILIHTFWTTNVLSCAAKSDETVKLKQVKQSSTQHCTNSSKDTVTHSETANQHPTTKRTHCTKQHATLLAAKRSVVTSDSTETKPNLHNYQYKYQNRRNIQARNKRPIKSLQFRHKVPKLHKTTHSVVNVIRNIATNQQSQTNPCRFSCGVTMHLTQYQFDRKLKLEMPNTLYNMAFQPQFSHPFRSHQIFHNRQTLKITFWLLDKLQTTQQKLRLFVKRLFSFVSSCLQVLSVGHVIGRLLQWVMSTFCKYQWKHHSA